MHFVTNDQAVKDHPTNVDTKRLGVATPAEEGVSSAAKRPFWPGSRRLIDVQRTRFGAGQVGGLRPEEDLHDEDQPWLAFYDRMSMTAYCPGRAHVPSGKRMVPLLFGWPCLVGISE